MVGRRDTRTRNPDGHEQWTRMKKSVDSERVRGVGDDGPREKEERGHRTTFGAQEGERDAVLESPA